ncbi:unnamed protein product [Rhizoctonia solani]|uniref:C2H2-type domain-containing protein n=1 Tax=Rhizoctonia solani TaxID=456999 RepID=A0A8H2WVE7_9AGAM|nr:unnamed protein product [Rhizoctonia solani]
MRGIKWDILYCTLRPQPYCSVTMVNSGFSNTSFNTFDARDIVSQGLDYNSFITWSYPVQGNWYQLSFVQEAGWFHGPMYFMIEKEDGTQEAFCWTVVSCCGDAINYIWRVYWDFEFKRVLGLGLQFQNNGPSPFRAGDCLFHADLGGRAVWRQSKDLSRFSPVYDGVSLHRDPQVCWFRNGTSIFITNNILAVQSPVQARPSFTTPASESLSQSASNLFDDPVDTPLNPVSTPPSRYSDTSSDISVDVYNPGALETEPAMRDLPFFSVGECGRMTLNVPLLEDREAVKYFLKEALGHLDKKVREVKCSLCKNKKADKLWNVKPSNLERHILGHLGIKDYPCNTCAIGFTTKDQLKKHTEKKHAADSQANTQDGSSHEMVELDIYTGLSPITNRPLPDEIESWIIDQSYQGLQTDYAMLVGENCDFSL